ncbi:MAG TPA: glycosyltransferase family 2 protein [Nitrospirota bacterium]
MDKIRLSICIPTYNYGAFIGETLNSITDQLEPDAESVEVVVVDGASTDNTPQVVENFRGRIPKLVYHRLDRKGGIDSDLERTVDLAHGEYCWLLSSDDVQTPGALSRILHEIEAGYDIYLFNRTECDKDLRPRRNASWLSPDIEDSIFPFTNHGEFISYFKRSRSIGALFSYISSIIVRREKWLTIPRHEKLIGSNYAHVFRLFSILLNGGVLKYIKDPLVLCRGDNDSFLDNGLFHRYLIDIDGYLLLASELFPDEPVRRAFLAVMRREHDWRQFVGLKSAVSIHAADNAKWIDLERKLLKYGYPRAELFVVRMLGSSRFLRRLVYFFIRLVT